MSVFEANLNFTFCPKGSVVIPSCSTRKGYRAFIKGEPRITLLVKWENQNLPPNSGYLETVPDF